MTTRHVFETYIRTTPEAAWQALTDPAFTRRYLSGLAINSGWEPGGRYTLDGADGQPAIEGVVEECVPPARLVMTWRVLFDSSAAAEPPSRVTWEITAVGDIVRVTCVHGDLAQSPVTWSIAAVRGNIMLSGLKTLLETGEPLGAAEAPPTAASAHDVDVAWHRRNGVECNAGVYALLDHSDRTTDDDARMVHMAHASAYHWGIAGGIKHAARAEYLLSRVYAFLGRAEPALHHATRCSELCERGGLTDFDRAFMHEAMARALACAGRLDEAATHVTAARAVPIADPEDRAICEADLAGGPWFGLTVA